MSIEFAALNDFTTVRQSVALIGVGCRFAGGINSAAALWDALLHERNLVGEIPAERWPLDDFYDTRPGVPGCSVSRWGGFLDDPFGFDAAFFQIGAEEAAHMDPQQRILLEVSVEALEHAGLASSGLRGSKTGLFHGVSYADYQIQLSKAGELSNPYAFAGVSPAVASGRIAYLLGLHGPAVSLDTACSASLTAVHLAMQSLRTGESNIALAGGISLHFDPASDASASAQGMLSPRGRCAAFDKEADGFVRAEGCAVVVLKRLSDAVRDGDRVLAVLRGSAINQDGRSQGLTAPNSDAQERVQRAALADAGIDPDTVGLVEAHGTGTPVGDPVEWAALRRVYGHGSDRCAVGSVKTNLGHTETVSGIAGLIKAVEAVRRGTIPANLHFTELNPALDTASTRLFVPTGAVDWPTTEGPRRAAVSSYGFSGTNAHVVLEAASPPPAETRVSLTQCTPNLFVLSATDATSLAASASRVADWLAGPGADVPLLDVAHTLACRRTHRPSRLAVAATSREELITGLRCAANDESRAGVVRGEALGTPRDPVWVFSGHGGQWPAMGRALLAHDSGFRAAVAELDPLIAAESGFSVIDEMTSDEPSSGLERVQPTIFAVQVGLAAAWRARGVQPAAVIGHSMGEVAAAVVAGRMTATDGVKVICRRTRIMKVISGVGSMAAIELPADQIEAELTALESDSVVVAVHSSPVSSVISGDSLQVRALVERWEAAGISARLVPVEVASHSPQVDPILDDIHEALRDLGPSESSEVTFYATALDSPTAVSGLDAQYWVQNLRNPVRFSSAVRAALDDGHRVFVELSPHPLLLKAIVDCAAPAGIVVATIATLRREQFDADPISEQVGAVHCAGAGVDFGGRYRGVLVDVPLPVWSHQPFSITTEPSTTNPRQARGLDLGTGMELPGTPGDLAWQSDVGRAALPWVDDHQVFDSAVLPGAAFADMALAAAEQIYGVGSAEVRDLTLKDMLFVSDHTHVTALAEYMMPGEYRWETTSHEDEGHRVRHASATLSALSAEAAQPTYDLDELYRRDLRPVDLDELRRDIRSRGVHHGPSFSGLARLYRTGGEVDAPALVGELHLPNMVRGSGSRVHPALLDACFQALLGSTVNADDDTLLLPVRITRIRSYGGTGKVTRCVVHLRNTDSQNGCVQGDIDLLDAQGRVALRIGGLVLDSSAERSGESSELTFNQRVLAVEWEAKDPLDNDEYPRPLSDWVVLAEGPSNDTDLFATDLVEGLRQWGAKASFTSRALDHDAELDGLFSGLGDQPRSGLVVLCPAASREAPEVDMNCERLRVRRLIRIVAALAQASTPHPPRVYVVTRGAQQVGVPGDSPHGKLSQTALRGLCRVAGAEHPELRIVHADTDQHSDAASLAYEIAVGDSYDETAWRHNRRYVASLCRSPLQPADRHHREIRCGVDNFQIVIREPGDLDTVEYQAVPRTAPGPDEVEVRTIASSLNFADVLAAMGTVQTYDGGLPPLGVELAGEIIAVGDGVTEWAPGDRVVAMARPGIGGWRAFDTLAAGDVHRIPRGVDVSDAAAFFGAYLTAWYGLHTLAQLRPGERVLIHSATGGVGMAAIAIAQLVGAEIFATAGSPEKRELLQRMGIDHVYDSRSVRFADQIRADTVGDGVDVVLNSLTGHAQRVSIDLVSVGGRFVEIGKKDIYADSKIGLLPFRRNIAFYSVDLLLLRSRKNELCNRLAREVLDLITQGLLPVIPHSDHPLAETARVLRTMASARHTGKLALTFPTNAIDTAVVDPCDVAVARADGAYILTGGLGGLGLLLAHHLAETGAGRIVVNSRSQPTGHAAETLDTLRANGTDVVVAIGDICEPATAHQLIATATETGLPVRGIVHAAAVVDDAAIVNIDTARLDRNWNPKVLGAWNLHTASENQPLDWFCCFSSAAALLGSAGQGAYAAANSWMDAFVAWRRNRGLPATAIAWGAWAQVGRGAFLGADGRTAMIAPDEGIRAFDLILRHQRAYAGYLPTRNAPWIESLAERSPFAAQFATAPRQLSATADVLNTFTQTPAADRGPFLQKYLCGQIAKIIRAAAVDPGRRFTECGLDSLGKLELRTRIDKDLGIRVSTKLLWEHDTAHRLALYLLERAESEHAVTLTGSAG